MAASVFEHMQLSARFEHPADRGQACDRVRHRAERARREHLVEGGVGIVELVHILVSELEPAWIRVRSRLRNSQHAIADVDPDDVLARWKELDVLTRPDRGEEHLAPHHGKQTSFERVPPPLWPEPVHEVVPARHVVPLPFGYEIHTSPLDLIAALTT